MQDDDPILTFDVTIHAAPQHAFATETIEVDGRPLEIAKLTTQDLPPFQCTFEEACERLAALPRMFIEPDGSFVWQLSTTNYVFQLDGNLYDRRDHLLYVTLKGRCSRGMFDDVLNQIGWPDVGVIIEDTYLGQFNTYASFIGR